MIAAAMLLTSLIFVIHVADTVPRYDVRSPCRAAVTLSGGGTEGRTVDNCVAGEDAARKDLEKEWAKIPVPERTQCTGTVAVGGSPSYVELLICTETHASVRKTSGRQNCGSQLARVDPAANEERNEVITVSSPCMLRSVIGGPGGWRSLVAQEIN
jgi:hypothetical protein